MKNNKLKIVKYCVVATIIVATFLFFGFYINDHPELVATLRKLDLFTLALLTIGYSLTIYINALVLYYSLRFLRKQTPVLDNILLTGYSSIINFFGPLQSGPGFRAVYLKKKHRIKLRDFFVTTLIFYGFFGFINLFIIALAGMYRFGSILYFLLLIIFTLTVVLVFGIVVKRITRIKQAVLSIRLDDKNFWLIGLGALALTITTAAIYFVEIHHVNPNISTAQTIAYTAAANLSLFVAITPGAIGIREVFLALSQQLHGIDTTTIVGANIIDRAFYIGFLAVLFVVLLIINSRKHILAFGMKFKK